MFPKRVSVMRLLVVDDDIIIRHYFLRSLRRHVDVHDAAGMRDALTKLHAMPFDVVLADERLPDGSGRVLLARARLLQPHCRRVLMSGHDVVLDENASYERFFAKLGGLPSLVTWIRVVASGSSAC
jgi:DNA-binding NtrC family response regulator